MGWNIVMLRQACHFALEKKIKQKTQGNSKLELKLPKNSRKLWEISIYQNFFRITDNSRIFSKTLGVFFRKLKNFSKNSRIFQIYSRIFPQILDLPDFFLLVLC